MTHALCSLCRKQIVRRIVIYNRKIVKIIKDNGLNSYPGSYKKIKEIEEIEISDEDIPLTDIPDTQVPQTGDSMFFYIAGAISAMAMLAVLSMNKIFGRKNCKDAE